MVTCSAVALADCPVFTYEGADSKCYGSSFNLSMTYNGSSVWGIYWWERNVSGGSGWETVNGEYTYALTTGAVTASTTYRIHYELDCGSGYHDFEVSVSLPLSPPVTQGAIVCGTGGATVIATPHAGYIYKWYQNGTVLNPELPLADGQTFTLNNNELIVTTTSSSITLEVTATDNYNNCGESSPSTVLITRHPIPTVSIGGNETLCVGGSYIDLSSNASPAGGVWRIGNENFGAPTAVFNGLFNPGIQGNFDISYTYHDNSTTCEAVAHKTITVGPIISFPTYSTCKTALAYELEGAFPPGGTWSGNYVTPDGIFSPVSPTPIVGSHSVTYTVTYQGCTGSKSVNVETRDEAAPSFPYSVPAEVFSCGGLSSQLVVQAGDNPQEVDHYLWLNQNGVVQRRSDGSIEHGSVFTTPFLTSSQTFSVLGFYANGCAGAPGTVTLTIANDIPPSVSNGYNCDGTEGTLTINSPVGGGYYYEWITMGGQMINGSQNGNGVAYTVAADTRSIDVSSIPPGEDHSVQVRIAFREGSFYCTSVPVTATVIHKNLPVINLGSSIPATVCSTTVPFSLTGASPSGGSWDVDNGSIVTSFIPSNYDVGAHVIGYRYNDQFGCYNRGTTTIEIVDPSPPEAKTFIAEYDEPVTATIQIAPANTEYRWYDTPYSTSVISTGNEFQTPAITSQKLYYVMARRIDIPNCEGTTRGLMTVIPLPPNNYNYVKEEIMLDDIATESSDLSSMTEDQKSMTVNYIDGIGRPMQIVKWRSSPTSHDIVQPIEYDLVGREAIKYLPYVPDQSDGSFRKKALNGSSYEDSEQKSFYSYHGDELVVSDLKPYAVTNFEKSPLGRVAEQGAVGTNWQPDTGKTVKMEYLLNDSDQVYLFHYNHDTGSITLSPADGRYYSANRLVCNKVVDEHGNDALEYSDTQGRIVCKKVRTNSTTYASTYYIYDDVGNLVVVIPPEGVKNIVSKL
jgi:hypothetical protein